MASTSLILSKARRAELEALFDQHGTVTAQIVLEHASDPHTALHSAFEWDDTEAGHNWRLHQARMLITRTFTVIEVPGSREERRIRFTVSLPPDRGNVGYRKMEEVLSDHGQREILLRSAFKELSAFQRKYEALEELAVIFEAIDAAKESAA